MSCQCEGVYTSDPMGYAWVLADKGYQVGRVGSKAIDFYAFSRGSFRKPARNLIARAQRKSQEIETQGECTNE